ncbi:serine/threonine-protein kinase [Chondromyces apiculatus]|uniref:Serine/threonine protein kinase PrkC, regulator of stationary phase n=1 Tax=Chondromyces apiculatus DSM 436 TaxID=1192034 RepID=A0A017SXP5_9BACT|nr:serine/threonine-protein kinase [Chondromyces apiculatus]EYF01743.1 Serine/threonine protein kinase PrkC, regulator of stationary phase [Chondromyces apiculatus DSM 436]
MPWHRAPADALVGRIICGSYRVIQRLGSGGTGDVYLAERTGARLTERLALKVLRAEHAAFPDVVARFEREAEAAARVRHPSVLRVERPERDGEIRCFAMELLVGLDLADTLASARALTPSRAVRIALEASSGLHAAHLAGVIHRDVKPENLFLVHARDGREVVRVLDFGLAYVTEQNPGLPVPPTAGRPPAAGATQSFGTLEYLAPELIRGAQPSPGSDVYALGTVLYEMLAGRTPFSGPAPTLLLQHQREPLPPLHRFHPGLLISRDLDAVARKALLKDPGTRFSSMAAFHAALLETPEALEDPTRSAAARTGVTPFPGPPGRRATTPSTCTPAASGGLVNASDATGSRKTDP